MMCAWQELLGILPQWMRNDVDKQGKTSGQELRLRLHSPPELITGKGSVWFGRKIIQEDIAFIVNGASRYSPWTAFTVAKGYLTAPGGHRIGICGEGILREGKVSGFSEISSLCIRIARDYPGIAQGIPKDGNVLILGAPGWGKTTLLRDLIRTRSEKTTVAVADERGELFPSGVERGRRMDVLTGIPKPEAMDMLLRTMGPGCIAVDEITSGEDCEGLIQIFGCGVSLLATAHASSSEDFHSRRLYRPLWEYGIFDTLVILGPDKGFWTERVKG